MSDSQNDQTVAAANAIPALDDILPKWERQPDKKGPLNKVERREKAANAALRKVIQKLLDQLKADGLRIVELTTINAALEAEKDFTERGSKAMADELRVLRRLKRQFANVVGAAAQIAAASRKCTMNVTMDDKGEDLTISYQLEDGTRVVHLASETDNYQSVQIGSGDTQIVLPLGRGTGFAQRLRVALKGYFKPDGTRVPVR